MNTRQIKDKALFDTHTNDNNYPDAQALLTMNIRYADLVDLIVNYVKERFFWDIWETDTIIWQSEYLAESLGVSPDDLDIKKIDWLYVRYKSTDQYMKKLTYRDEASLTMDKAYYEENTSESDAFFYIADDSYFIYPTPSEAVTNWIKLEVIHAPADLTMDSVESDIELERQFHYIISLWLEIDIYKSQGKLNESSLAQQNYDREAQKMVSKLKDRYDEPIELIMPNLTVYE